jgi:hypothetical protein
VVISEIPTADIPVAISFSGTATSGVDYSASAALLIPAGLDPPTIDVPITLLDDGDAWCWADMDAPGRNRLTAAPQVAHAAAAASA